MDAHAPPNADEIIRKRAFDRLRQEILAITRLFGQPSADPATETVGRRAEAQAALMALELAQAFMFPGTFEHQVLDELRKIQRAPSTDHEAIAAYWERIWRLADKAGAAEMEEWDRAS